MSKAEKLRINDYLSHILEAIERMEDDSERSAVFG